MKRANAHPGWSDALQSPCPMCLSSGRFVCRYISMAASRPDGCECTREIVDRARRNATAQACPLEAACTVDVMYRQGLDVGTRLS